MSLTMATFLNLFLQLVMFSQDQFIKCSNLVAFIHCMALNDLLCADVLLRAYTLTLKPWQHDI